MKKKLTEDEAQTLVRLWQKCTTLDEFVAKSHEIKPGLWKNNQKASKWAGALRDKGVALRMFDRSRAYNYDALIAAANESGVDDQA